MKALSLTIIGIVISIISFGQRTTYEDYINFETPPEYLVIDTTSSNNWQIGKPHKAYLDSSYSSPNGIITDTINSYNSNDTSSFILKLDKVSFQDIRTTLKFWNRFETDSINDYGIVEVSYNEGETWTILATDTTYAIMHQRRDVSRNGIEGYLATGQSGDWIQDHYIWQWLWPSKKSSKDIYPEYIWIKFSFISDDFQSDKDGWLIDDIHVYSEFYSSVHDSEQQLACNFFPNPCKTSLTIIVENEIPDDAHFFVFDDVGKLVLTKKCSSQRIRIDTESFQNGLYTFRLISKKEGGLGKGRFIVIK